MNHLGLFAKFWLPGTVKTRLAKSIGDQRACDVYHHFLFHLLGKFHDAFETRSVVYSPPERYGDFRSAIDKAWNLIPQVEGDLGLRMLSFFQQQLGSPGKPNRIVIIGADCPQLSTADIESAFAALDDHDAVIGPSTDGGYYLLGMRNKCVNVFEDIEWSTKEVFAKTLAALHQAGASYKTLPHMTDVDDRESLQQLLDSLANTPDKKLACLRNAVHEVLRQQLDNQNIGPS